MVKPSYKLTDKGLKKLNDALVKFYALYKDISKQEKYRMLRIDRGTLDHILKCSRGVNEGTIEGLCERLETYNEEKLNLEKDIDYELFESLKASQQGIDIVKSKLKLMEAALEKELVAQTHLTPRVIKKFLSGKQIPKNDFKLICSIVKLNWKEIVEISKEEQSGWSAGNERSSLNANGGMDPIQIVSRPAMTVTYETSRGIRAVLILEGNPNSVSKEELKTACEAIMQELLGRSIKILDIQEGSIKLIVEGSPEDIKRLVSTIKSGELKELNGFPIKKYIQTLSESLDDEETAEANKKWSLIENILSTPDRVGNLENADLSNANLSDVDLINTNLSGADLSGVDLINATLSGADLSDADLSDADLSDADLSDANLSNANLSNANLSNANLSGANLSGANLSGANLSGANLSGANLSDANVKNARFGAGTGLSEDTRLDLKRRGAIFVFSTQPSKKLVELRLWLRHIVGLGQNLVEDGWQTFEDIFASPEPIAVRSHRGSKHTSPNAIASVIRLLQPNQPEQTRRQAAGVLGEIGAGNPDAINALTELLHSAKDEETRWQAALSLGKVDPKNPQAGIRKARLIDLGIQLGGITVALVVTIMPKANGRIGVFLQVQPHSETTLPSNLKLSLLSESGEARQEVEARSDLSGRGKDKSIELRFSPPPGTYFRVRVTRDNVSVTEDFIA